jgi:hypothetical protein
LICVALGNTLDENANDGIIGRHPMWQQECIWFFALFHHEFRKHNAIAFAVLMVLAVAHMFGFYNPKQLADFLDVPHQQFYTELKEWSIYHMKKMLLRFMGQASC